MSLAFFQNLSLVEMLLFVSSIVLTTAAGITAFLLFTSGSMRRFRRIVTRASRSQPPPVTDQGAVLGSKEELEAHLETLQSQLMQRVSEIEMSMSKVSDAKQSIERLHATQSQVKKYYVKLREEIKKSEMDCKQLQTQIDDYKKRRVDLEGEMKRNESYYKSLLDAVKNEDSEAENNSSRTSLASSRSSGNFYESSAVGDVKADEPPSLRSTDESSHAALLNSNRSVLELCPTKEANVGSNKTNANRRSPDRKTDGRPQIEVCCCGSAACAGNCNIARCLKLGFLKPEEILEPDIAKIVDPQTCKIVKEVSPVMSDTTRRTFAPKSIRFT